MIYVDVPFWWPGNRCYWSHLWADGEEELLLFAELIGLKDEWIQRKKWFTHFDVSVYYRNKALQYGAQVMSLKQYMRDRSKACESTPISVSRLKKIIRSASGGVRRDIGG
jgi:hypothetical protein